MFMIWLIQFYKLVIQIHLSGSLRRRYLRLWMSLILVLIHQVSCSNQNWVGPVICGLRAMLLMGILMFLGENFVVGNVVCLSRRVLVSYQSWSFIDNVLSLNSNFSVPLSRQTQLFYSEVVNHLKVVLPPIFHSVHCSIAMQHCPCGLPLTFSIELK